MAASKVFVQSDFQKMPNHGKMRRWKCQRWAVHISIKLLINLCFSMQRRGGEFPLWHLIMLLSLHLPWWLEVIWFFLGFSCSNSVWCWPMWMMLWLSGKLGWLHQHELGWSWTLTLHRVPHLSEITPHGQWRERLTQPSPGGHSGAHRILKDQQSSLCHLKNDSSTWEKRKDRKYTTFLLFPLVS